MGSDVIGPSLAQVIEHWEVGQKCSLAAHKHPVMSRRRFLGWRNGLGRSPEYAARGNGKTVPHKFATRNSLRKERPRHRNLFLTASVRMLDNRVTPARSAAPRAEDHARALTAGQRHGQG